MRRRRDAGMRLLLGVVAATWPISEAEIEFRAIQTYDDGEVTRWIDPADADSPAPRVNGFDLGAEEGQGTLAVIADLREQLESLQAELQSPADDSSTDGGNGTLMGSIGIGLGAIALVVALLKKR